MGKILTNDIRENVDTFIHEKLISDILLMQFCLNSTRMLFHGKCYVARGIDNNNNQVIIIYILFRTSLLSKYLTNTRLLTNVFGFYVSIVEYRVI